MSTPGALSQSIINIRNVIAHMQPSTLFSAAASTIRQSVVGLFDTDITDSETVQAAVLKYNRTAQAVMQTLLNELDAGTSVTPGSITALQAINTDAAGLVTTVNTLYTNMANNTAKLLGLEGQLTTVKSTLNSELATVQTNLTDAQNNLTYFKRRENLFLALGIAGLATGVAASRSAASCNAEVNTYSAQFSALKTQIMSVDNFMNAFASLINNSKLAVSTIAVIKIQVGDPTSNIQLVANYITGATPNLPMAKTLLTAALNDMQTLATDAS